MKSLQRDIRRAVDALSRSVGRSLLIFHDDADGVVSAYILKSMLESMGWRVDVVCLEKLYPQALNLIGGIRDYPLIVFSDLASPHSREVKANLEGVCEKILIVDHHDPVPVESEKIIHLNPELYSYSGEEEASASTMAYLVIREALKRGEEYSSLAIIGSAEIPGPLRGLNKVVLEDALRGGLVRVEGKGRYIVKFHDEELEHWRASSILSTIASIGYYRGGPIVALETCDKGFTANVKKFQSEVESLRREIFKKGFGIAYKTLRSRGFIQWFHVGRLFYNIGAKALGLLTSQLAFRGKIARNKYLFGMMVLNPEIPGLGVLSGSWVKVSGRVPADLKEDVSRNTLPPINKLMVEACKALGGFADGHSYAASGNASIVCARQGFSMLTVF